MHSQLLILGVPLLHFVFTPLMSSPISTLTRNLRWLARTVPVRKQCFIVALPRLIPGPSNQVLYAILLVLYIANRQICP